MTRTVATFCKVVYHRVMQQVGLAGATRKKRIRTTRPVVAEADRPIS